MRSKRNAIQSLYKSNVLLLYADIYGVTEIVYGVAVAIYGVWWNYVNRKCRLSRFSIDRVKVPVLALVSTGKYTEKDPFTNLTIHNVP